MVAVKQIGDHSVSEPVPSVIPSLRMEKFLMFLLKTTSCDSNNIVVENMQVILSEDSRLWEINGTPFVGKYQNYKFCLYVRKYKGYFAIGLKIMKSDKDKKMVWPFSNIVVLQLINQSGKEDEIKMFRSEKNASQLKDALSKPKKDMNLPIGYPRFISKERLLSDGFVRDNIMLVHCYIFPKEAKINCPSEYPSIIR